MFDAHQVCFVSVTQSVNTTPGIVRLTLNMSLSFALFEHDVTGKRIRGKIASSKRKGIRKGGVVALGYRLVDRKLLIDEEEALLFQLIFERYTVLASLPALDGEPVDRGFKVGRRLFHLAGPLAVRFSSTEPWLMGWPLEGPGRARQA